MPPGRKFRRDWSEPPPAAGTYRAIFKYGDPARFKHPSDPWYEMLKEAFDLTDADFGEKRWEGREALALERPCGLSSEQVAALTAIVGQENATTDVFQRTSAGGWCARSPTWCSTLVTRRTWAASWTTATWSGSRSRCIRGALRSPWGCGRP